MAKTTPRIFIEQALSSAAEIDLAAPQAHYLVNVLRMSAGDPVLAFNGSDGEWNSYLVEVKKKSAKLRCETLRSAANPPPDIDFMFAPLKHARLDYMVQKAVELGARRLCPIITQRTIAERVNLDRMRANVIEAAEQCNLVYVPEVLEPRNFERAFASWSLPRAIIFCDETATVQDPLEVLKTVELPAAIVVGPEGGFTNDERALLKSMPAIRAISLGPRTMRADTAALAALTIVQAALGDWR